LYCVQGHLHSPLWRKWSGRGIQEICNLEIADTYRVRNVWKLVLEITQSIFLVAKGKQYQLHEHQEKSGGKRKRSGDGWHHPVAVQIM
jgi:hypothetical protein